MPKWMTIDRDAVKRVTIAALLLTALTGLAFASRGNPDMCKVTGLVTLNGKPVNKATVTFIPDDDGPAVSTGYTDDQGRFDMDTIKPGDGMRRGVYRVLVACTMPPETPARPIADVMRDIMMKKMGGPNGDPKLGAKFARDGLKVTLEQQRKPTRPRLVTPPVYADLVKTPLRAEIRDDRELWFDLQGDVQ